MIPRSTRLISFASCARGYLPFMKVHFSKFLYNAEFGLLTSTDAMSILQSGKLLHHSDF